MAPSYDYQSVSDVFERLDSRIRASMEEKVIEYLDSEQPDTVNSTELGATLLSRTDSSEWTRAYGRFSRQCFGILLKTILEDRGWEAETQEVSGRSQRVYYHADAF